MSVNLVCLNSFFLLRAMDNLLELRAIVYTIIDIIIIIIIIIITRRQITMAA